MRLTTPEMKDSVLNTIFNYHSVRLYSRTTIPQELLMSNSNINQSELFAIMDYFLDIGFITNLEYRNTTPMVFILQMKANDFYSRGGFTAQEGIFKSNLEKLTLEITYLKEELEPKHLERINSISAITGVLLAGLTYIHK